MLSGDRRRLVQVLTNLIENALKHTVSSAGGKGSVLSFTIALAPIDISSPDDKYACLPQTLPSLRILAVDDIPDNLKLLSFFFAGTPFGLTPCLQAVDALELLEAGTFDCMLTDICMPNFDGGKLIRTIREQESRRGPGTERMPIIAISAAAYADDIQNALDAGCDEYLPRPVGRRDLIGAILRLTNHECAEAEIPDNETDAPITGGMLERVRQRIAACRDEVADACRRGDLECAIRAGHSIKGLGMAFNLPEVERMGAGIEKASREGDSAGVMEMVK